MNENPLRVLVVCSHPVQYMSPILRRMSHQPEIKLQVAYCSLHGANASYDPDFNTIVQWDVPLLDGYDWIEVPNRGTGGEGFWRLRNPGLWRVIRRGNFDAVICLTGYVRASFWIAYFAARLGRSAFIFGTDASSLAPRDSSNWKAGLKKRLWPRLFRLADQVVVSSSGGVELMLSLGIPADRITLIPFVVDNEWWSTEAARTNRMTIRKGWGVAQHEFVVLFCAKLQPWKRPADLLRAFARARLPDTVLVFAGDGPLRPELETEANSLGIANRVRFLGFVNQSQLPAVYTATDLMVLPSDYEPFAVVVNEAACCGCPVAASDRVGAGRDLIAPVNPQLIYPCGDINALADLLRAVFTNPSKLLELGEAARRRMDSWAPRNNVAATIDAVTRAIRRRRGHQSRSALDVVDSSVSSQRAK
jgi:glycosyltransferase involved in cell wall biosynthesis